jgi:hypothetical protein
MTTKRDYAASITTKGLDGTGLTEDVARKLYSRRGRKAMAVVELVVDETSDKRDGTHKVALAIAGLELVLDHTDIENHLRDLQQTIYANRQRADGQMAIDEQLGGERTVEDVLSSGRSHRPHPFIVVDASVENPICDVCGGIDASAVHSTQDVLDQPDDPENPAEPALDTEGFDEQNQIDDERAEEAAAAIDEAYDEFDGPHAYDAGPDDVCQCGLPFEHDVHATTHPLTAVPDPFTAPA